MNVQQIKNNLTRNYPQVWVPVFDAVRKDYPNMSLADAEELAVVRVAAAIKKVNKLRKPLQPAGPKMLTLFDLELDKGEKI